MAIAFRNIAVASSPSTTVTSLAGTMPTGWQPGDLLIAHLATSTVGSAMSTPTGWTKFAWSQVTDGTSFAAGFYYRVAQSGDTAPTITWTTTSTAILSIAAYSGVDQTNPIITSNGTATTTATANNPTPSLTNSDPTSWAVAIVQQRTSTTANKVITFTPDAALTERADNNTSAGTSSPWVGVEWADSNGAVTAAAHSYTAVATFSESHHIGALIYLKAAATGTTSSGITISNPVNGATTATTTQSSFTIAVGTVSVGQTVIVCAGAGNAAISNVTDNLSNSYALDKAQSNYSNNGIYHANVTTGGTCTVTVTTAAASNSAGTAWVVSGLNTTLPLDQTAGNFNATADTAPSITTPTTTSATELVIGMVSAFLGSGTVGVVAGSGYVANTINNTPTTGQTINVMSEYKIVSATGTQTANATLGFSAQYDVLAATYKLASGGVVANTAAFFRMF